MLLSSTEFAYCIVLFVIYSQASLNKRHILRPVLLLSCTDMIEFTYTNQDSYSIRRPYDLKGALLTKMSLCNVHIIIYHGR